MNLIFSFKAFHEIHAGLKINSASMQIQSLRHELSALIHGM